VSQNYRSSDILTLSEIADTLPDSDGPATQPQVTRPERTNPDRSLSKHEAVPESPRCIPKSAAQPETYEALKEAARNVRWAIKELEFKLKMQRLDKRLEELRQIRENPQHRRRKGSSRPRVYS
jgi:hypothetical protein